MADLIIACAREGRPRPYAAEDLRLRGAVAHSGRHRAAGTAPRRDGRRARRSAAPTAGGVWVEGDEVVAGGRRAPQSPSRAAAGGASRRGGSVARMAGAVASAASSATPRGGRSRAATRPTARTLWRAGTARGSNSSATSAPRAPCGTRSPTTRFSPRPPSALWSRCSAASGSRRPPCPGRSRRGRSGLSSPWDTRVRRVPPDTRVVLDRATWRVDVHETPVVFAAQAGETALTSRACASRSTPPAPRSIWRPTLGPHPLRRLRHPRPARGARRRRSAAALRHLDDARLAAGPALGSSIARVLARHYGVEHESLLLDGGDLDLDTALTRFVAADVGRNDEIGGYLDGFAMWRRLTSAGVSGVVRGDEPFGDRRGPATAEALVRASGSMVTDYPDDHLVRTLGLAPQSRPAGSATARRGPAALPGAAHAGGLRAHHAVRPQRAQGALRRDRQSAALTTGRRRDAPLSGRMLDRERAFLAIVGEVSPAIPMARFSSTSSVGDVLAGREVVELVVRELTSPGVARVLHGDAPARVLGAMAVPARSRCRGACSDLLKEASLRPTGARRRAAQAPGWMGPDPLPGRLLGASGPCAGRWARLSNTTSRGATRRHTVTQKSASSSRLRAATSGEDRGAGGRPGSSRAPGTRPASAAARGRRGGRAAARGRPPGRGRAGSR